MLKKLKKFIIITAVIVGMFELAAWARVRVTYDTDFTGHDLLNVGNIDIGPGGSLTIDTMTLSSGSIIDTTGAITFGNENLTTTGTIVAGVLDADQILTPYENTVTVAKSGADYTTIQAAIDSIADASAVKPYVVRIYPGVYNETLTGSNYVSLIGLAAKQYGVIVTATSGTLYTAPNAFSTVRRIKFEMEPTASGSIIVAVTAGIHRFTTCDFEVSSATNDITATIFSLTGGTTTINDNSQLTYDMDGTLAGVRSHWLVNIAGDVVLRFFANRVDADVDDEDDTLAVFNESSVATIETLLDANEIHVDMNHAAYSGACGIYYAHGLGTDKNVLAIISTLIPQAMELAMATIWMRLLREQFTRLAIRSLWRILPIIIMPILPLGTLLAPILMMW